MYNPFGLVKQLSAYKLHKRMLSCAPFRTVLLSLILWLRSCLGLCNLLIAVVNLCQNIHKVSSRPSLHHVYAVTSVCWLLDCGVVSAPAAPAYAYVIFKVRTHTFQLIFVSFWFGLQRLCCCCTFCCYYFWVLLLRLGVHLRQINCPCMFSHSFI